jgi:hypothetical protein
MADEIKNMESEVVKEIVLTVTLKQDGNVSVTGPLIQKPICMYMLEIAKDVVKMYNPAPPIIKPRPRITDIFRR